MNAGYPDSSPFKGEAGRGMGSWRRREARLLPHPHPGPPLEGEGEQVHALATFELIVAALVIAYVSLHYLYNYLVRVRQADATPA